LVVEEEGVGVDNDDIDSVAWLWSQFGGYLRHGGGFREASLLVNVF